MLYLICILLIESRYKYLFLPIAATVNFIFQATKTVKTSSTTSKAWKFSVSRHFSCKNALMQFESYFKNKLASWLKILFFAKRQLNFCCRNKT